MRNNIRLYNRDFGTNVPPFVFIMYVLFGIAWVISGLATLGQAPGGLTVFLASSIALLVNSFLYLNNVARGMNRDQMRLWLRYRGLPKSVQETIPLSPTHVKGMTSYDTDDILDAIRRAEYARKNREAEEARNPELVAEIRDRFNEIANSEKDAVKEIRNVR